MFISDALAASAPAISESTSLGANLVQLAFILIIFYVLLIRPQQKRVKEHIAMVNALKVGDRVLTNGGIYGRISKIEENELSLEIAPGVDIVMDRMSVSALVNSEKTKVSSKKDNKTKMKNKNKK